MCLVLTRWAQPGCVSRVAFRGVAGTAQELSESHEKLRIEGEVLDGLACLVGAAEIRDPGSSKSRNRRTTFYKRSHYY